MKSYLLLLAVLILPVLSADIRLPSLIGDHMVLQRSSASRLWGTAAPGEKVSAEIGGIREETTADRNGSWSSSRPGRHAGFWSRVMCS